MLTTKAKVKLHNDVTNNETIHYLLHHSPPNNKISHKTDQIMSNNHEDTQVDVVPYQKSKYFAALG